MLFLIFLSQGVCFLSPTFSLTCFEIKSKAVLYFHILYMRARASSHLVFAIYSNFWQGEGEF